MSEKIRNSIFPILIMGLLSILAISCDKQSDKDDNPVIIDTTINNDTTSSIPSGWNKVGNWTANNIIWSITSSGSNVYVAGYFTNSAGYCYVAKWDGASWSELGNLKANDGIFSLTTDAAGNVYAVGNFTNGAVPGGGSQYVAMWDGSKWNDIGGGGGTFISADEAGNIYKERSKWDGSSWSPLCNAGNPIVTGSVYSIISNADGTKQYAAGDISLPNGYRYVSVCDGSNCWSQLGNLNANSKIHTMVTDKNGDLYAAGSFTDGNLPTTGNKYVARWNGSAWGALGNLKANGDIYYLASE